MLGSVLFTPSASPPMPGVKGAPVLVSFTPRRGGPEVTLASRRGRHNVNIFHAERLVDSARAHIANQGAQVLAEFALDRQVPLHHVISGWMGIEICLAKTVRRIHKCKGPTRKRSG